MEFDERTFHDACNLEVRVETNVPQGGDAGHGGKTRITLRSDGSFVFDGDAADRPAVELEVLGDAEGRVLAEALIWAGQRLQALIEGSGRA